jgi:hypothetical protein
MAIKHEPAYFHAVSGSALDIAKRVLTELHSAATMRDDLFDKIGADKRLCLKAQGWPTAVHFLAEAPVGWKRHHTYGDFHIPDKATREGQLAMRALKAPELREPTALEIAQRFGWSKHFAVTGAGTYEAMARVEEVDGKHLVTVDRRMWGQTVAGLVPITPDEYAALAKRDAAEV